MKTRFTIVAGAVLSVVGVWVAWGNSPAAAGIEPFTGPAVAIPLVVSGAAGPAEYSYVGNKKCKKCHLDVHKSWAKTTMGKAFETLKPGAAREAKAKHGLDAATDYTTDATCLQCHTTGYGEAGGYEVPDSADKRAIRKAKNFRGVGCESCHGPGSGYVKILEEIDESQRTYRVEELYSAGMRRIDKKTCLACHNDKSPTISPDAPFEYDKIMEGERAEAEHLHPHKPLKLREP